MPALISPSTGGVHELASPRHSLRVSAVGIAGPFLGAACAGCDAGAAMTTAQANSVGITSEILDMPLQTECSSASRNEGCTCCAEKAGHVGNL